MVSTQPHFYLPSKIPCSFSRDWRFTLENFKQAKLLRKHTDKGVLTFTIFFLTTRSCAWNTTSSIFFLQKEKEKDEKKLYYDKHRVPSRRFFTSKEDLQLRNCFGLRILSFILNILSRRVYLIVNKLLVVRLKVVNLTKQPHIYIPVIKLNFEVNRPRKLSTILQQKWYTEVWTKHITKIHSVRQNSIHKDLQIKSETIF